MSGTAERFAPNSHGRRVWSFARTSWNVMVKSQRLRSPGTKKALCTHNTPQYGRSGTASLQITSRKQLTRRLDRCRGVSSAGCVRWAWRANAGLCHAFLVILSFSVLFHNLCFNYNAFWRHQPEGSIKVGKVWYCFFRESLGKDDAICFVPHINAS